MSCLGWSSHYGPCGATDCDNCYPGCRDLEPEDETIYLYEASDGSLVLSRGEIVVLISEDETDSFADVCNDWDFWSGYQRETTIGPIDDCVAEWTLTDGVEVVADASQTAALFLGDG